MAKTKKEPEVVAEHVIVSPLEDLMGERFGRYSKYIIQERALPDARDGLKPVQRRILYTMFKDGNTYDKGYRKSAKSVGLIMGNYHPHGDSSIYDAMVRLSQNWKTREPLIDMHGNNGSMDDDPAAAMRYTEARLAPLSKYMLSDIDKETVQFVPNFDDTDSEPTVLPARYPNLLVNGITGIAAGYATNIPPHNLSEVINATVYRIENPNCSLIELMNIIKGPDFPTGGIVQGVEGIKDAFTTGKGRVVVRSKTVINQEKTCQQIIVSEVPYEVIKCNLVKKIDEIRINKKIDGILDVRDESDRNGLRICIDIKKDMDAQLILNYLLKNTELQVYYNYNVVAIVNKRPVQLGLAAMLDAFIDHRRDVITKRCVYELNKKEKRCHILEGLIKCISVLDEIIAIIRAANDKSEAKTNIIKAYQFSEEQAEAIVTLRLYRLSNTDVVALKQEFSQLLNDMEYLNDILDNPKMLQKEMITELNEIVKEFGSPRLSVIEDAIEDIVIDKLAMINNEQVMFTISRDGYFKKVSLRSFQASDNAPTGLKDGDELIGSIEVSTLDNIMFFTNQGTYGYTPVYEIDEYKWKDVGAHINSIIKMEPDEKIISCFVVPNFNSFNSIISVSKLGMIKRSSVNAFEVSRNSKTINAMNLSKGDEVVSTLLANKHDEIFLLSKNGYVNRYPISLIPETACKSKGVKAMKLVEDEIVSAAIYDHSSACIVILGANGMMKRLKISEISVTGRGVKGDLIAKRVKSKPNYVNDIIINEMNYEFLLKDLDDYTIAIKDVSLMSKDSTFSTPNKLSDNYYLQKQIVLVPVVEAEIQEETHEVVYEEMNLDI
ncbi:MAG: DNA topoisomerase IV subunit A [Erysipelotrichaceae bacterium]